MPLTTRFARSGYTSPPLSSHAAAVDRLRRVLNAVRDAQETLERLVRTEPVAVGSTLSTPIEDLEWTVVELSTALAGLQEPAPTPYPLPVLYEPGQHPADSDVSP